MKQTTLKQQSYSEQVVRLIKNRTRNGRLRSGDRISELSIAEECGISRSPVREAMLQLENDGFIMVHPRAGRCVTILTPEDIRNRYEVTGALEAVATASASVDARVNGHDWAELKDVLEKIRQTPDTNRECEVRADLGTEFHRLILKRADNPLITELSWRYCRSVTKFLMFQQWQTLYTAQELYDRHYAIYDLLLHGTPREVEEGVRAHYADTADRLAALCPVPPPARDKTERKAHFPKC